MTTKVLVLIAVVASTFATACTVTLPESGRPLTVTAGNPGNPAASESSPAPSRAALAYDDEHADRAR